MSNHQVIRALLTRPIAFHPALSRLVGRATAGIFLSQLLYWCERSSHENGWVYKTTDEWTQETTLSEDEQRGARKLLVDISIIELAYAWKHFPAFSKFDKTYCYRIAFDRLFERLEHVNFSQNLAVTEERIFPPRYSEPPATTPGKSLHEHPKLPVHSTETTSKTTTNCEMDELVDAAMWAAKKGGRNIANPSGWRAAIRKRLGNGATADDMSTLCDYRRTIECSGQAAAQKYLATKAPAMDPHIIAAGANIISGIDKSRRSRKAKGGM